MRKTRATSDEESEKDSQTWRLVHINFIYFRMFHIDDVPSGAGEGIKDISKALAVCTAYLTLSKWEGYTWRILILCLHSTDRRVQCLRVDTEKQQSWMNLGGLRLKRVVPSRFVGWWFFFLERRVMVGHGVCYSLHFSCFVSMQNRFSYVFIKRNAWERQFQYLLLSWCCFKVAVTSFFLSFLVWSYLLCNELPQKKIWFG